MLGRSQGVEILTISLLKMLSDPSGAFGESFYLDNIDLSHVELSLSSLQQDMLGRFELPPIFIFTRKRLWRQRSDDAETEE
jgi:hypothetical protein